MDWKRPASHSKHSARPVTLAKLPALQKQLQEQQDCMAALQGEPGLVDAMVRATDGMREVLK